ncbi:MAG: L,D-transpeptidase family protein [Candidatus Omnitrophica bacterium]|nr:L,D-transpeptidase family protein [Candidatus Omnitrophota bacterium]
MKKWLLISSVLLLSSCKGIGNLSFVNPAYKARKYLNRSLQEYRIAIKNTPGDKKLIEEYVGILTSIKGEVPAKIEFAILLAEIGLPDESETILMESLLKDRETAEKYLASRINEAKSISERIILYQLALKGTPDNGEYWYQLGRLYLGINNIDGGIKALEKAYLNGIKEPELFYYLAKTLFQRGNYKEAELYINEGLKIAGENAEIRQLRYALYVKQKKLQLAKLEKEKIKQLKQKQEKPEEKVSEFLAGITPYEFLYVSKQKQELYICQIDSTGLKILERISCSTGKNKGTKMRKGDQKTPEGTYRLYSRIEGPSLPAKYGIAAYPLNYPNLIDRRLQKDGNGIWLHGTPIERHPYNSDGCVVINDDDMKKLVGHIVPGKTFISIGEEEIKVDYEAFKKGIELVKLWKNGWESLDIEKYISVYDEMFYGGGRDKKQYKAYKEKINKQKKHIKVEISELQMLPYGKTPFGNMLLAFFKQSYSSDNFSSRGYKILYLVERESGWYIIGEEML